MSSRTSSVAKDFVELCSGIGGLRAGLEATGWKCRYSCDLDPHAVAVHRLAFGECELRDARSLEAGSLPKPSALVAGFPCQPFSSSGSRTGFAHRDGTVFDAIVDLAEAASIPSLLLENVRGLLSTHYGFSMAYILSRLCSAGYYVEWAVLNSAWLGVPQSRPRVLLVASRAPPVREVVGPDLQIFGSVLGALGITLEENGRGELGQVMKEREPRKGLRRPSPSTIFGDFGVARGGAYVSYRGRARTHEPATTVGAICAPSFRYREEVRSVRYWGHSGETKPYLKAAPIAHCLGTNIGAGPTFAVSSERVKKDSDLRAFREFANWNRDQAGLSIIRLRPERALQLFGKHTEVLADALLRSDVPTTDKYRLIGNMVAPEVGALAASALRAHLASSQPGQA